MYSITAPIQTETYLVDRDELFQVISEGIEECCFESYSIGETDPLSLDGIANSIMVFFASVCIEETASGNYSYFLSYSTEDCIEAFDDESGDKVDEIYSGLVDFMGQNEVFMHTAHDMFIDGPGGQLVDLFLLDCMEVLQKHNFFYVQQYGSHVYNIVNSPLQEVW